MPPALLKESWGDEVSVCRPVESGCQLTGKPGGMGTPGTAMVMMGWARMWLARLSGLRGACQYAFEMV